MLSTNTRRMMMEQLVIDANITKQMVLNANPAAR
jgi:hypothetical protein